MCKVAAYLRISRASQSIERQRRNVKELYPNAVIFEEAYTGTKVEGRKEWERLYNLAMSGKVEKIVGRKTVNKKELLKLEASPYYDMIMKKYRNEKIVKNILSMIATIISSDFTIIDYYDRNLDGKKIETVPDIVIEEVLMYTLLI